MNKPTENELFELYDKVAYMPNDGQDDPLTPFGNFCAGYEAAQQQSAGEIAELKEKLSSNGIIVGGWQLNYAGMEWVSNEVYCNIQDENDALKADNERLQAQINELKSLLNEARDDVAAQLDNYQQLLPYKQHRYDAQKITLNSIDEALTKTAPQCLIEHDNEVLERAAQVADDMLLYSGQDIANRIRELKGK